MDFITNIINYVKDNWVVVVELYLAIVGLASVIVKITPSTKDDAILQKIMDFLGKYIALNKPVK